MKIKPQTKKRKRSCLENKGSLKKISLIFSIKTFKKKSFTRKKVDCFFLRAHEVFDLLGRHFVIKHKTLRHSSCNRRNNTVYRNLKKRNNWLFSLKEKTLKGLKIFLLTTKNVFKKLFHLAVNKSKSLYYYIKEGRFREITPAFVAHSVRRHLPLFLAVLFITPAAIFLGIFIYSRLNQPPAYATPFTGAIKISRQSTTLSTDGDWLTSLAHSGDGVTGDAESGTFNPIHPGGTSDGTAGSGLAIGYMTAGATTYATTEFIGFRPSANGNLTGIMLVLENTLSASRSDVDIVVELLRFPSAVCTTTCSNYVTGSLNSFTFPADTEVLRRTVWQFNQGLSGENMAPGNFGRATFDFRFDSPVAVNTSSHYGIRIINMGSGAPVFGAWAANAPFANFPIINGAFRTIGVKSIDNVNAPTVNMPLALSGNSVIILGTSPTQSSGMVAGNSLAGVGLPTIRRTENEHWTATYSLTNNNWTIGGSVSGVQNRRLTTATTGGTGPSWVNDGVAITPLAVDSAASNRLCVTSSAGFAVNQTIDLWDSDTATLGYTIASVNASDGSCPGNGPSIITTAATVVGYTVNKNATVAQAVWKQRIIQGAETAFSQNMPTTSKICVVDASQFSVRQGAAANLAIWDNNSVILATNAITAITVDDIACVNPTHDGLTLASTITAGTYTIDQNARVAEISTTLSNIGTPANNATMRWTTFNHTQNPTASPHLARTSSVMIGLAKNLAPAQSGVNYPFLSNNHIFFTAYGDANTLAPADGDIVVVGNGRPDPDSADSPNLIDDLNWSGKQEHVITIDRHWSAPLVYTGSYGSAVLDGAGARADFSAYSQNAGWISAVIAPSSQLLFGNALTLIIGLPFPEKLLLTLMPLWLLGNKERLFPTLHFKTFILTTSARRFPPRLLPTLTLVRCLP